MSDRLRSLSIRVDKEINGWASVVLMVDGADILGGVYGQIGYDPAHVFAGSLPLMPVEPSRRVGLYRCDFGFGADSNITAIVAHAAGDQITWQDFANCRGRFDRPVDDLEPYPPDDPDDDYNWVVRLPLERMTFDAEQYTAEYDRARSAWFPRPCSGP